MKTVFVVMSLVTASVVFAETNPFPATVTIPEGAVMGEDDEGVWYPLGSGVGGGSSPYVSAIAVSGSDVYVGGKFTEAGGNPANNIARWDGEAWHSLGGGVNGAVYAVAVSGPDVYVGGRFTEAGGVPVNRIARWDGEAWHTLGSGVNGTFVRAITVNGPDVYVGGDFTEAGGINTARRIARWDGAWHALKNGVNGAVYAIAVSGSDVYAGGFFTMAGDIYVYYVAHWDGTRWYSLKGGVGNKVSAVAVSGSDVYVGGFFSMVGDYYFRRIAHWDGEAWHMLGSGISGGDSRVYAIAMSGPDVYVGGYFIEAGGVPVNHIARWDGEAWHSMGGGVCGDGYYYPRVCAIAMSGTDVYAGGWFTEAGGVPANRIARWVPGPTGIEPSPGPAEGTLFASPNPMTAGTNLSFRSIGASPLTLSVYDVAGRLVKTQDLGTLPVGSHSHYWDGRDGSGSTLAEGVYLVRLSSTEQQASIRVVMVR